MSLSHTVVHMAPICPGDTVTASILARNVSNVEQVRVLNARASLKDNVGEVFSPLP